MDVFYHLCDGYAWIGAHEAVIMILPQIILQQADYIDALGQANHGQANFLAVGILLEIFLHRLID